MKAKSTELVETNIGEYLQDLKVGKISEKMSNSHYKKSDQLNFTQIKTYVPLKIHFENE